MSVLDNLLFRVIKLTVGALFRFGVVPSTNARIVVVGELELLEETMTETIFRHWQPITPQILPSSTC